MKRISAPQFPAVSSDQLREWLRLDDSVDESTLDMLLGSAVDHVQSVTGQIVVSADYQTVLCLAPGCHAIPISNPTAVTLSDASGDPIDPTDAYAIIGDDLVLLTIVANDLGALTIRITAGWTTEEAVPQALRHAIAVLVGASYDGRTEISDQTFTTVSRLCRPYWKPSL